MTKSINFDTDIVLFSMGWIGNEAEISHDLGRVPEDGFIIQQRGAGNLYRGTTAWTSTAVFFLSGVPGSFFAIMLI